MRITQLIQLSVLLPLALGLAAFLAVTLIPMNLNRTVWSNLTSIHINQTNFTATRVRVLTMGNFIENYFNQSGSDLGAAHDYATSLFSGQMSVARPYETYYGVATVDPRTPSRDVDNAFLASDVYKHGVTQFSQVANLTYLNESSVLDNVFRALFKASTLYDGIYMGFNTGLYRYYPYARMDSYNTMAYTCAGTGQAVIGYDPRCRIWYVAAQATDNTIYTSPYIDALTSTVLITAARRVMVGSMLIGVLGADFKMTQLDQLIVGTTIMTNGYAFLMDGSGDLISYPNLVRTNGNTAVGTKEPGIASSVWSTILAEKVRGYQAITKNGASWMLIYEYLPTTGYYLVALYPQSDVTAAATAFFAGAGQELLLGTIVLCGVMALFIVLILTTIHRCGRKYTKPITELTDIMGRVAKADLDVERGDAAPISAEFEVLGKCFDNILVAVKCGVRHYHAGNLTKALEAFDKGLQLVTITQNHRGLSVCYNNKANVLKQQGNTTEAERLYKLSIDHAQKQLERESDPRSIAAFQIMISYRYMNLGVLYKDRGNTTEALTNFSRALDLARETDNARGIAKITGNMGQLYLQLGQIDRAEALLAEAFEIIKAGHDEISVQYALMNFGLLEAFRHNFSGALAWFSYILVNFPNLDCYVQQIALDNMVECLKSLGRHDEAARLNHTVKPLVAEKDVSFILDVSGSMAGTPLASCKHSIEDIITHHLGDTDKISLIVFNNRVHRLFEKMTRAHLSFMLTRLHQVRAEGGTAFYDALLGAYRQAVTQESGTWLVALTDGADNGSATSPRELIATFQKKPLNLILIAAGRVETRDILIRICQAASSATTKGIFIEIGRNDSEIQEAFAKVAKLILGQLHVDAL